MCANYIISVDKVESQNTTKKTL